MVGRGGGGGLGEGVGGCYQPGVYVPLKALFLVEKCIEIYREITDSFHRDIVFL